tara:strand:- start:549 stop:752 length:204 start_codon:yes stop_codon:yes gene_type:complete
MNIINKITGLLTGSINTKWNLQAPSKRGGSYSIYFGEKHIANVRGKIKANVLIDALQGKDTTNDLVK